MTYSYPLGSNTLLQIVGFHLLQVYSCYNIPSWSLLLCKVGNDTSNFFCFTNNLSLLFSLKIGSLVTLFKRSICWLCCYFLLFLYFISLVSALIVFLDFLEHMVGPSRHKSSYSVPLQFWMSNKSENLTNLMVIHFSSAPLLLLPSPKCEFPGPSVCSGKTFRIDTYVCWNPSCTSPCSHLYLCFSHVFLSYDVFRDLE